MIFMRWSRIAFVIMLTLALLPAVSVNQPNASGQSYVTITTQTTATIVYAATTRYETVATSSYVYEPRAFTLGICGSGAGDRLLLRATKGQRYHVEWNTGSSFSLNFYITTAFSGSNNIGCSNFPESDSAVRSRRVPLVRWTGLPPPPEISSHGCGTLGLKQSRALGQYRHLPRRLLTRSATSVDPPPI